MLPQLQAYQSVVTASRLPGGRGNGGDHRHDTTPNGDVFPGNFLRFSDVVQSGG